MAIDYAAMENYVAQLARSSLFGSWVFCLYSAQTESYSDSLSGGPDFKTSDTGMSLRSNQQGLADIIS